MVKKAVAILAFVIVIAAVLNLVTGGNVIPNFFNMIWAQICDALNWATGTIF